MCSYVRQWHNSKLHKIIMPNFGFTICFRYYFITLFLKIIFSWKKPSDRKNDRHCDKIESPLCSGTQGSLYRGKTVHLQYLSSELNNRSYLPSARQAWACFYHKMGSVSLSLLNNPISYYQPWSQLWWHMGHWSFGHSSWTARSH